MQRLESQRKELKKQIDAIGENLVIRKNKLEIESLLRELPIREKAEADRTGSMSQVLAAQERDLRKGLRDLADGSAADSSEHASIAADDLGRQVDSLRLSETERVKVGRLASTYEKLVGGCEDVRRQISRLQGRIEQAERELAELPPAADRDAVDRALDEIGSPMRLIEEARQAESGLQRWERKCQATQQRLGVEGSPQHVAALGLPDPADVQRVAAAVDAAEEECRLVRRRVMEMQRQVEEAETEYEAAETQTHLPTAEELNDARRERDQAITAWTKRLLIHADGSGDDVIESDSMPPAELPSLVHRADQIVDQLRMHHAEVHRLATATTNVQTLTSKRRQLQSELDRCEADLKSAQHEWETLWTSIGVVPRSPEAMTAWVGEHQKLIEQIEQLTDARTAEKHASDKIDVAMTRLRTLVEDESEDGEL